MATPIYASRRTPVVPLPSLTLVETRISGPRGDIATVRYRVADSARHVAVTLVRGLDGTWTRGAVVAPDGPELDYPQRRALADRARADLRRTARVSLAS